MTYSAGAVTKCFYAGWISLLALSEEPKDSPLIHTGLQPGVAVPDQETVFNGFPAVIVSGNLNQLAVY